MSMDDGLTGHNDDGSFYWDPEDKRLREDGMAADGSRLNPGDILEDGSEWYVGWPEPKNEGDDALTASTPDDAAATPSA